MTVTHVNTLLSGQAQRFDCYAMCCQNVTYLDVFMHDVLHMHFSAIMSHLAHQGYQHLEAGCLGLMLQAHRPFLTPHS